MTRVRWRVDAYPLDAYPLDAGEMGFVGLRDVLGAQHLDTTAGTPRRCLVDLFDPPTGRPGPRSGGLLRPEVWVQPEPRDPGDRRGRRHETVASYHVH